jgi:hypothetical protein
MTVKTIGPYQSGIVNGWQMYNILSIFTYNITSPYKHNI